jgi:AraC-like DNA-binding protein
MDNEQVVEATDTLADVLKTIRLRGSAYFCSDFTSPWGMDIAAAEQGMFHVVVDGSCYLQLDRSDEVIQLQQGDIVAFPTGGAHWISDDEKSQRLAGNEVVEEIRSGNNPFAYSGSENNRPFITSTLLCGSFAYDQSIKHPFLTDLPCFIHIQAVQTPELEWLRNLVKVLSNEARNPSPGSSLMVDRLSEVLFIQLMRFHMQQLMQSHDGENHKSMGYMAALNDTHIGKALNLIHNEQDAVLTVESLADAVSLSRTAFSDKFSKLVGMPAKSYLLNWRMQRAKVDLQDNKTAMVTVAENAGYASEASFSKAFKRLFSLTPGQFRKK